MERTPIALLGADDRLVGALLAVLVAVLAAAVVDRVVKARGIKLAERMSGGQLTPEVRTRLQFLRRFIGLVIIVVGVVSALAQLDGFRSLATSILASGALLAATVGFAARQVIANLVAGVMLAVTQPVRVGDHVVFEDEPGVVVEVKLATTILRTPSGRHVIVPNEKLASDAVWNDSMGATVGTEAVVWIAGDADVSRALEVVRELPGANSAVVADATPAGLKLSISGAAVAPGERFAHEAEMREAALAALRGADVPAPVAQPGD